MLLWYQAAMDFVMEEDLKAHLTCWYIQKYVKENPHPQCFIHSSQWPCTLLWQMRKQKSLPGDKQCVATCFVITAQHSTQDLPEIDKRANKIFQGWKILYCCHLRAKQWTEGSRDRRQEVNQLSAAGKQQDMGLTGADACYLSQQP